MTKTQSTVESSMRSLRCPLLFLTALLGLSACAGTSTVSTPMPTAIGSQVEPQEKESPEVTDAEQRDTDFYLEAAEQRDTDFYLEAAEQAAGQDRDALLLRAAESAHFSGNDEQALEILEGIDINLLPNLQRRRAILLLAELGQYANRPLTLLAQLQPPNREMPADIARRVWAVRANAHLALGQTLDAIEALVMRESLLSDPQDIQASREHIWRTLRSSPAVGSSPQEVASYDRITRGWAELADAMLDLWLGPDELRTAIQDWEREYPAHPANQVVLDKDTDRDSRKPVAAHSPLEGFTPDRKFDTIALLLPLSGNYANPAAAIRDGFMTAYYRHSDPRPKILVFDTGAHGDIEQLAEQAILAGADILVGPLAKDNVSRIAQNLDSPVPVLALNYLKNSAAGQGSFYQFGLSPEDEAAQVAERALADGHLNALALAPNTDWGRRTLQAFQERLLETGGYLVDFALFDPDKTDYRDTLTRLLQFRGSGQQANIRQDMDYIFLAANPREARLVRPQLRFFRATRVPVYATSHVFTGRIDPRQDQDLDGIRFGDMPWILDKGMELREARDTAKDLWPDSYAELPRLYALGFDAFALATQIARNNLRPGFGYPAASGVLTLQQGGRISRGLVWAHFSGGRPHVLSDKPPSEEPLEEETPEDEEEGYLPEELAR